MSHFNGHGWRKRAVSSNVCSTLVDLAQQQSNKVKRKHRCGDGDGPKKVTIQAEKARASVKLKRTSPNLNLGYTDNIELNVAVLSRFLPNLFTYMRMYRYIKVRIE
jgi:hypothetical protein